MLLWLQLLLCLVLIGTAGFHLSRFADAIAEKSGLTASWVGLTLLATVTSLPELATGLSSVTAAAAPDIAVGDLLGSCVFNLLLLVALDFLYRRGSFYTRARQGHIVSAGFGTVLLGFAGFNLVIYQGAMGPRIGHVGLYAPLLILLYLLAARALFRYEREQVTRQLDTEPTYPNLTLARAAAGFAAAAVVVVLTGIWLPFLGVEIAMRMGWSESFVGTLLVAAVTSAPEVAVTIAALRLGALDLAIANVLGSNLLNVALLGVDDFFYAQGPLLERIAPAHAASAFSAMMMSGMVTVGLTLRPKSRVLRTVSWISLFLMAVYLLNTLFPYLYLHGS
ncbi:MAG TPA: sodium:calcium antiporter [Gammaproteobacteria bacterium]|jgi:cation:H+ antiporter|nr:sodium:calcium antiporter [Gammaproteobacteria bacterium]